MQQVEFNVFYLIRSVKKHLLIFIGINIAVLILSIVYSLLAPVKYEAKAIFYPFSPESSDPRIMMYEEAHFSVFGYSDQVERYTKIGKSNGVKYTLAAKYDLFNRYKIDTDSIKLAKSKLLEMMTSEVLKFEKGENGGVLLSVFDANPDTAAMMCNDVISLIDSINTSLLVEKNIKVFNLYKLQLTELDNGIREIKDSINIVLRSDDKYKDNTIKMLHAQLGFSAEEYAKVKTKYELSKTLTSKQLNSLYQVEPAQAPYKKAKPNRKAIIAGALIISLILSTIAFTILEFVKDNKEKFVF